MNDLFESSFPEPSPEFIALKDEPRNAKMKNLVQEMWKVFFPWADPNFPQEFSKNLHPRFWEMYLGTRLLERNFKLVPKKSSFGPDFQILLEGKSVWIEAIAPEDGTGKDAVPSIDELNGINPIPEDKIILRFTNAISTKIKKREDYIEKGVISADDAFIIALNGRGINMTLFEGPMPAIVKSVYPVGDYSVTIDVNTLQTVREGYKVRHEITKASGSSILTNIFLNKAYSGITGILYSNAALWDMPTTPGCEFLYIDNSVADTHLELKWLGTGKYCYKEENHLTIEVPPPCA